MLKMWRIIFATYGCLNDEMIEKMNTLEYSIFMLGLTLLDLYKEYHEHVLSRQIRFVGFDSIFRLNISNFLQY